MPRRFNLTNAFFLAAATALSAACSSSPPPRPDYSPVRETPPDNREVESFANLNEAMRSLGYSIDWTGFPYVAPRQEPLFASAADGLVLFMDTGASVTALKESDGSQVWTTQLTQTDARFLDLQQVGSSVMASSETELFVIDAQSGTLTDRQRLNPVVNTEAIATNNLMVYGTSSGNILGHTLDVGAKLWAIAMQGAVTKQPRLVDGIVACASDGGEIVFVDPRNGRRTGDNRMFKSPGAELGAGDRFLYVPGEDQTLYAFNPRGGRLVWKHLTAKPIYKAPVFHAGVVYCDLFEEGLTAFDAQNGNILWSNQDARGEVIAVRNNRLILWDGGVASVVDRQRGDVLQASKMPNVWRFEATEFVDGDMIAINRDGSVSRYLSTR